MRPSLQVGLSATKTYEVTPELTVPHLLPQSDAFGALPEVLATGYMVALIEWTCIQATEGHLDEGEQSLGVHVCFSHEAPTPVGSTVTIEVELVALAGRAMTWQVHAYDEAATIARGTHGRAVIDRAKFDARLARR